MNKEDYIENWYVTIDLMCIQKIDYLFTVSMFFIGYGLGIVFFFIPDYIGRKKAMMLFLPLNIIAIFAVSFSQYLTIMKIGLLLIGMFHLKSSISYTHCFELVPN